MNKTSDEKEVLKIYADGACLGNPGPGGYGVVLLYKEHRKELSAGFRKTTNNRMELMGAIAGLENLKRSSNVTLYTDSQYVVNGIMKGWAQKWKQNRWIKSNKEKAINPDLWEKLLSLCLEHKVELVWVKGHAGDVENERCDVFAKEAAESAHLQIDSHYEKGV